MGYSFKWILEHLSQSFTVASASYATFAANAGTAGTASFVTASNVWGPYGASSVASASWVTGSIFSGSNLALSASYALTAAFALNAGGGGGGGTPGGANTTIQFNSGGFFSGSNNFTFNSGSNTLTLSGSVNVLLSSSAGNGSATFILPASQYFTLIDQAVTSRAVRLTTNQTQQGRVEGVNYGTAGTAAGFLIGGSSSDLVLATNGATLPIHIRPGSYANGGGSVLVSGSLYVSQSVYFTGLTTTAQTNVITINPSTGQLYYTASSAFAATPGINGIDQYLGRFSGSNAIETGSVYNYRIYRSLLSGDVQSLSIGNGASTYVSQSALFGTQSFIHSNVYKPTVSNAHSFGEYNSNVGGNAAFNANTATTTAGDHDFVQNLLASTAPRIHFSGYDSANQRLYAPFAGDIQYLADLGRLTYFLVADLITGDIIRGNGLYYPAGATSNNTDVINAAVSDSNFTAYDGATSYIGALLEFSGAQEVLVGNGLQATTGGHLVCFLLDGADGYYNTEANHASNIGTSAHGYGTHAEGYYTQARGHYTHAENDSTVAAGSGSTASGYRTVASGKYNNANNAFTAAGSSYLVTKVTIRRSNRSGANRNFYYDFDNNVVGFNTPHIGNITWFVNAELGTIFNSNGYTSADSYIRCIVQIPSLNYSGIVELFAADYGSSTYYVTTLLDLLTDGVSEITDVDVIITPLEIGTFFETQNDTFGGGPGYGAFAVGVRSIATNSGSFAGGVDSSTFSSSSMTFGTRLTNRGPDSILFGIDSGNAQGRSFVVSYNGNNNLFVSGGFVGINTATRPTSNYSGLVVNGTTSVGVDLYVTGSSYLGNDLNDVTRVTGSLLVSNSFELRGVGRVTGSLIVSNSLNVIGTSQVTGSQIVSSSW